MDTNRTDGLVRYLGPGVSIQCNACQILIVNLERARFSFPEVIREALLGRMVTTVLSYEQLSLFGFEAEPGSRATFVQDVLDFFRKSGLKEAAQEMENFIAENELSEYAILIFSPDSFRYVTN